MIATILHIMQKEQMRGRMRMIVAVVMRIANARREVSRHIEHTFGSDCTTYLSVICGKESWICNSLQSYYIWKITSYSYHRIYHRSDDSSGI